MANKNTSKTKNSLKHFPLKKKMCNSTLNILYSKTKDKTKKVKILA